MKLLIVVLLTLSISAIGFSAEYRGSESIVINEGDSLGNDLISASRYVDVLGFIDGDQYSASQRINVEGEIAEDFFGAAQEINIKGKVNDMVFGAAEKITIDGEVGGDVVAFGSEVRITPRSHIHGNLFVGCGFLSLDGGRVDGWVRGRAGDLFLNGSVGDSVILEAGTVRFGNDYTASQGTHLTLKEQLDKSTRDLPPNLVLDIKKETAFYESGIFYWSIVAMFIVGLLISLIFKDFTYHLLNYAGKNILKNIGIGFLLLIASPVVIAILAILILTLPAALILLALYLIILYISSIFTGLFVGKYAFELTGKKEERLNLVLPLIVGLIIIVLLSHLPVVGWLIKLVIISFGMGSFILYLWGLKADNNSELGNGG